MLPTTRARRELGRAVFAMIFAVTLAAPSLGQESSGEAGERVRGFVPPPTGLQLVGDHWTPYDPPTPPEGATVHVIEKGDTLWDLAGRFYEDNYLWPVIWDANRYITYSHWIYPGDPLVIPPKPGLVGDAGLEQDTMKIVAADEPAEVETPTAVEPEPEVETPSGPVLVPAAVERELACSGTLAPRFDDAPLTIMVAEEPGKELHGTGDVVYLSGGRDMGVEPGNEYSIVRAEADIEHPVEGEFHSVYVNRLGTLRVIAVQDTTSTAEISFACDAIGVGDSLMPYATQPIPMAERISLTSLYTPEAGDLNGVVVFTQNWTSSIAGTGDMVGIDLATGSGVTVGDRILFWRDGEGRAPRRVMAQGIVLATTDAGSTVKVLESLDAIEIGDFAEVL